MHLNLSSPFLLVKQNISRTSLEEFFHTIDSLSPLELLKIILAKRNKGKKKKVPHFPVALKALLSFFNLVAPGYMR
jgi:hypothetical protein